MFIAVLYFICQAALAKKHVHGEGMLFIAQEQKQWQFEFLLPAADLLGFEYMPQTAEQKQQVSNMITKIENVDAIITRPTTCQLVSNSHTLDTFTHSHKVSNHSHKHGHGHEQKKEQEHIDIRVNYIFSCQKSPSFVEVNILQSLDSLESVDVQWITEKHQGAAKLTQSSNIVKFLK